MDSKELISKAELEMLKNLTNRIFAFKTSDSVGPIQNLAYHLSETYNFAKIIRMGYIKMDNQKLLEELQDFSSALGWLQVLFIQKNYKGMENILNQYQVKFTNGPMAKNPTFSKKD